MKKTVIRIISAFTVAVVILSAISTGASAAAFYTGQVLEIGKVTKASSSKISAGVTYDEAYIKDKSDDKQHVQTLTFNPLDSAYVPLVYSKYAGYGATTLDNAKAAETAGYDVKGGVNGSFFSFTGGSANIYGGLTVSDGKVMQGNNSYPKEWVLAVNSNGTSSLVQSKVAFSFTAQNGAVKGDVECINICPETTYNVIYYYDRFCGTKTDTKAAGVEIVFDKMYNTELTIGGTLIGRVSEVRNKVSSGGAIGEGQFVLYAPDKTTYAASLRKLKVGDVAEVTAKETVAASKSVMENCSSAVVTYGYNIVKNGKNVTSSDGLGEQFNKDSAQRTGLGIKADGSMVFVVSDGRSEDYPGLTVYELADLLISMGCVTAVNFDGGYSTQMVIENGNGAIVPKTEQLRRVANSILIVKKQVATPSLKTTLKALTAEAALMLVKYQLGGDVASLKSEINRATALESVSTAMDGDYIKAIMRLRKAIDKVTILAYREGIYKLSSAQYIKDSASSDAVDIRQVKSGTTLTVTSVSGDYGYTRYLGYYGYIDLTKAEFVSIPEMKSALIAAPSKIYAGEALQVSWASVAGASGYSYKISALAGKPGGKDELKGSSIIAEMWTTTSRNITVPVLSLTGEKYIRIDVTVEYPTGSVTSTAYTEASALPFTDISVSHWGYDGVLFTYERELFRGVTETRFDPNGTMTRAMMATLVYRMAGSPEIDSSITTTFTDIKSGSWYYDGVVWCQSMGIVTGISDTRFAPDDTVTREQAACFLYRYADCLGHDVNVSDNTVTDSFTDSGRIGNFAKDAMAWAVENGIMQGSGGKLTPKDAADRVQLATLICNFCGAFDVR